MLFTDSELVQKLVFESSEEVKTVSTFDEFGLKEDLLRGIYAYSTSTINTLVVDDLVVLISLDKTSKSPLQSSSEQFCRL